MTVTIFCIASSEIFRAEIFSLSSALGIGFTSILDRIVDEFFSVKFISQSTLDDINASKNSPNYKKSRHLVHELHKKIQHSDKPNDVLIAVCDILIKQEDEQLKRIGQKMKDNALHIV